MKVLTVEDEPDDEGSVMGDVQLQDTITLETQGSENIRIQPAGNVLAVEPEKASSADSSFSEVSDEDNLRVDEELNEDILGKNDDENMLLEDSNQK